MKNSRILLALLMAVTGITIYADNQPLLPITASFNELYSSALNEAIETSDPLAFARALQETGAFSKHAQLLLAVRLHQLQRSAFQVGLGKTLALPYQSATYDQFSSKAIFSIIGAVGLGSTTITFWPRWSKRNRQGALAATLGMGLYGIYALECAIHQKKLDKKEYEKQSERIRHEMMARVKSLTRMIEIVAAHPLKEE
jgi:hypothetical protein